jgi:tetratricopeptide (TPR) repeat protein
MDKRWGDAERYYKEVLKCDDSLLRPGDHIVKATDLSNLARMHARQGKLDDADKEYSESARVLEKLLPPDRIEELAKIYRAHFHLLKVKGEETAAGELKTKLLKLLPEKPSAVPTEIDAVPAEPDVDQKKRGTYPAWPYGTPRKQDASPANPSVPKKSEEDPKKKEPPPRRYPVA